MKVIAFIFMVANQFLLSTARTEKDAMFDLERGNAKVFYASIVGDTTLLQQGIDEGGDIFSPFDPFIGDVILNIGKPYIDFPICPPLHMAVNYGKAGNLDVASKLIRVGVNPNSFKLPTKGNLISRGYPPALLYGLGFGQTPLSSHAAFLQRLYRTHPEKFNATAVNPWINATGNPPLMHIPIYLQNFDGLYLVTAEFFQPLNTVDFHGLTTLHIAAWMGDVQAAIFLVHNGADIFIPDRYGRLPIHLACIRRQVDIIAVIIGHVIEKHKNPARDLKKLFSNQDSFGKTLVDMILLSPRLFNAFHLLRDISNKFDMNQIILGNVPAPSASTVRQQQQIALSMLLDTTTTDNENYCGASLSIETIIGRDISKTSFIENYHSMQRPVHLVGNLALRQGIWAYLQPEEFISRYGDLSVEVLTPNYKRNEYNDNQQGGLPTIECFLNGSFESPAAAVAHISRVDYEREWYTDFVVPEIFQVCGENDWEPFKMTLYDSGWKSSWQYYNNSWSLLISGQIVWHVISPGDWKHWLASEHFTSMNLSISSLMQHNSSYLREFVLPSLRESCNLYEIVQLPGDVIYLPDRWVHLVEANDNSVSLSKEFCTIVNTDTRIQPIGWVLYGGEDIHRGIGSPKTHIKSKDPPKKYTSRPKVPLFDIEIS